MGEVIVDQRRVLLAQAPQAIAFLLYGKPPARMRVEASHAWSAIDRTGRFATVRPKRILQ